MVVRVGARGALTYLSVLVTLRVISCLRAWWHWGSGFIKSGGKEVSGDIFGIISLVCFTKADVEDFLS